MAEITIRVSDRHLKIAFLVLTAVFLAWGLLHLWSTGVFRPKYQLRTFVPEAQGLLVGASVRLDGMPIGIVSRVQLAENSADPNRRIEVRLRIEKRFQNMIHAESTAHLVTGGLLGDRYVNIQRGFAGPPMNPGGELQFVPAKEATLIDFIDAIGKKANCQNEEQKNSAEDKSPMTRKKIPVAQ